MKKAIVSRREFLKAAATVAPFAGAVGCCCLGGGGAVKTGDTPAGRATITAISRGAKARVVLIRDAMAVRENRRINASVIQAMLDEAVTTLLEEANPVAAWKKIVKPNDVVGIKTNVWNYLPTGSEIEQAIRQRVLDAGVSAGKVSILDRGVLDDPIFQAATALINVRPARVHYWAGMGSCIKNYIMFVPKPSDYHADACADLASIWSLPVVKGKTRLNILSLLTPQFHNIGPRGFSEKYLWTYGGLLVGLDPVAVDATGYRIIQARRRLEFGEDKPLETSAHHIELADTRHHLGVADPARIEVVKRGWEEGILI
jgi:hypothetical protein